MTPEKRQERYEHHLEQETRQRLIKERAAAYEAFHEEQYRRIEEGYIEQSFREWESLHYV